MSQQKLLQQALTKKGNHFPYFTHFFVNYYMAINKSLINHQPYKSSIHKKAHITIPANNNKFKVTGINNKFRMSNKFKEIDIKNDKY